MQQILKIIFSVLLFAVVFVVVAFGIVWGPTLWAPVNETLTPVRGCTGECEYDATGDADGGPSWQSAVLFGPAGAPDLRDYKGVADYPGVADAEPLADFGSASRIRRAAAGVGRIQFLLDAGGRLTKTACTGFLISPSAVLTAAHCTNVQDATAPATVQRAAIRFGFERQTPSGEGKFFELDAKSIERAPADSPADFVVLHFSPAEAAKVAAAGLTPVTLSATPPAGGEDLFIVGHPLALAQVALRAHCRVPRETKGDQARKGDFLHTCGTAPGVSGAPIFADASGAVVGLHIQQQVTVEKEKRSVGFGVPLNEIAARSPTVRALLAPTPP